MTFNSAAHNKPSLIRDLLDAILPQLYSETKVRVSGDHIFITWGSRFYHREITFLSQGDHVFITWRSRGNHVFITWRSRGNHVEITWSDAFCFFRNNLFAKWKWGHLSTPLTMAWTSGRYETGVREIYFMAGNFERFCLCYIGSV